MDKKYYVKIALTMALINGFVAVQRITIAMLMPAIKADMNFSYTKVGMVLSVTGLLWAFGTIIWASIGDKYGRRPVIVGCTILAGVFSWLTGTVHSLASMLGIRGALGFFEGGPWGPMVATVTEESPPEKRGFLVSLIPAGSMIIGGVLAPIVAVWLMGAFHSWRPVFYVISIPGIITGIICALVMHEPASVAEGIKARRAGQKRIVYQEGYKVKVSDVLKYKNVIVSALNSIPVMAWLWVYSGFTALFLTKIHGMGMSGIGLVMSASGLGGFIGMTGVGRLSDRIGRKPSIILAGLLSLITGLAIVATPVGTSVAGFAILYFFWGMFGGAALPIYLGLMPSESVPPAFAGTAVAVPTTVGEIIGASIMPTIGGVLADKFGLYAPMLMASVTGLVVILVSMMYVETAPRKVALMKIKPTHDDHLLRPFRGKEPVVTVSPRV